MPVAKGNVPWNAASGKGWTDKRGYRWQYVTEGGRRVARREHRLIMERHLDRRLEPWELVHHKDGNPANNDLANLELTTFGEHTAEHHAGSRRDADARRSMEAFALAREELKRVRAVNADLLAALRGLVDCHAQFTGEPGHDAEVWAAADDAARAAIAKATGSQVQP